ncbi:hypothetical protein SNE40_003667 [Patella caerulea]|uniref:Carbonic anhydrase n=1 Tax=Patella caerulea TaxID=87958 RepID=A0AAN8K8B4_PATCE
MAKISLMFLLSLMRQQDPSHKAQNYHWSYLGTEGPASWQKHYEHCAGKRQSPININTNTVVFDETLQDFDLSEFHLLSGSPHPMIVNVTNNGHSASARVPGEIHCNGGGLSGAYRTAEFHFHWGSIDNRGSEHGIDGRVYPLEMHVVQYAVKYGSLANAKTKPDGLAVLGTMFEISEQDNPSFEPLVAALKNIKHEGNKDSITNLDLRKLLPKDSSKFYRYEGSLTTPPCFESVIWTVFATPQKISATQLAVLRSLFLEAHGDAAMKPTGSHGHAVNVQSPPGSSTANSVKYLVDNFRPFQSLNGRVVRKSFRELHPLSITAPTTSLTHGVSQQVNTAVEGSLPVGSSPHNNIHNFNPEIRHRTIVSGANALPGFNTANDPKAAATRTRIALPEQQLTSIKLGSANEAILHPKAGLSSFVNEPPPPTSTPPPHPTTIQTTHVITTHFNTVSEPTVPIPPREVPVNAIPSPAWLPKGAVPVQSSSPFPPSNTANLKISGQLPYEQAQQPQNNQPAQIPVSTPVSNDQPLRRLQQNLQSPFLPNSQFSYQQATQAPIQPQPQPQSPPNHQPQHQAPRQPPQPQQPAMYQYQPQVQAAVHTQTIYQPNIPSTAHTEHHPQHQTSHLAQPQQQVRPHQQHQIIYQPPQQRPQQQQTVYQPKQQQTVYQPQQQQQTVYQPPPQQPKPQAYLAQTQQPVYHPHQQAQQQAFQPQSPQQVVYHPPQPQQRTVYVPQNQNQGYIQAQTPQYAYQPQQTQRNTQHVYVPQPPQQPPRQPQPQYVYQAPTVQHSYKPQPNAQNTYQRQPKLQRQVYKPPQPFFPGQTRPASQIINQHNTNHDRRTMIHSMRRAEPAGASTPNPSKTANEESPFVVIKPIRSPVRVRTEYAQGMYNGHNAPNYSTFDSVIRSVGLNSMTSEIR